LLVFFLNYVKLKSRRLGTLSAAAQLLTPTRYATGVFT